MNQVRVSIIAAIDEKRGLGKNNDLLFKIAGDMQRVRSLTTGHPLVMGRKTFESLGRLLPNRIHIVITRNPESLKNLSYKPDVVVASLEEGLEEGKKYYEKIIQDTKYQILNTEHEVFIFGGGQIFTEAVEKGLVDRLYLTIVKGDYDADTFFPEYSMFTKIINKEDHEEGEYQYIFLDLEK